MNIHAHRKGATVALTGTGRTRRLAPDFPGWGAENVDDYFIDTADIGLEGAVCSVNSHGSAPHTRYTVKFADGSTMVDAREGTDIVFAA